MTHHLRPGLTDAVLAAHDAHQCMTARLTPTSHRRAYPILGDIFRAPVGTTSLADFQPLDDLGGDGIYIESDDYTDYRPHPWQDEPPITTANPHKITITLNNEVDQVGLMNLMLGIPDDWLIFQGEHTGLWWSIPDDNRCHGDIFHTYQAAANYALKKVTHP